MLTFSRQQHLIGQSTIVAVIIANTILWQNPIVGLIFGTTYLWLNSKKLSDILFANVHQGLKNILGLLIIMAYISLAYTLCYHVYKISIWLFFSLLILLPLIIELASKRTRTKHYFLDNINLPDLKLNTLRKSLWLIISIGLDVLLCVYLFKKASTGLIRSPWEILSYKFWILLISSNLSLAWSIISRRANKNIFWISLHFLLLSSIAIILYRLGYGYDSFIHLASLDIIDQTGTIAPRLWLYMGQYGLSLFLQQLWQISLAQTNQILLPLLFSILWPTSLYYGLRYGLGWSFRISYLSVLLSLFIGFGFAIMTTPQGLAFLLTAVVIFLLPELTKNNLKPWLIFIIALMTLSIHPLGGIALTYLAVILFLQNLHFKKRWLKNLIFYPTYLLSALSLPIFLAAYQIFNKIPAKSILNSLDQKEFNLPKIYWRETFNFPFDFLHNIGQNQNLIYAILVITGLILIFKNHKQFLFRKNIIFILLLASNYLLTKLLINFNLQIAYQKDDYPNRLLFLLAIACLPIFLTNFYYLFKPSLKKQLQLLPSLFIVILSASLLSISIYFSYPIYDKAKDSHSANVTSADLKTVQAIEDDASGQDYIVLANQMLGAAAIHEFGFAHYYNDNFYYSMPLGTNNIYQEFLSMIENEPSRETANKAMDKAQVKLLYFVVHKYWHTANKSTAIASNTADRYFSIDNGLTYVFVYNR